MSRRWSEIRSPYAAMVLRRQLYELVLAQIPYVYEGNDVNGVDCSGYFTYAMSLLNVEYTDRSSQNLYDQLFTKRTMPWFGPIVKAGFYGDSISTIEHVVFFKSWNSKWIYHSTNVLGEPEGTRADKFSTVKSWSKNWYIRYLDSRALYLGQF